MDEDRPLQGSKDAVLYLVDASQSMVSADWLKDALASVAGAIKASILAQIDHEAGIIVYGLADPGRTKTIMPLGPPSTVLIKNLLRLVEDPDWRSHELPSAPHDPHTLPKCLNQALEQFNAGIGAASNWSTRVYRTLVLVTNDDSPVSSDTSAMTLTRFNDLVAAGVLIRPIFLSDHEFDVYKFWEKVTYSNLPVSDDFGDRIAKSVVTKESLRTDIKSGGLKDIVRTKAWRKHTVFRASLVMGSSLKMSVTGYNVYGPRTSPRSHRVLTVEDREFLVDMETSFVVQDTGGEVTKDQLKRAYIFDTDVIAIEDDDMDTKIRAFEPEPLLRIVGFRHGTVRPVRGFQGHSTFVVPSDVPLQGSRRALASLRRSMLRKNVTAVVSAAPRRNGPPRLGYLYASPNAPGGLHLVLLPWVDELRNRPSPPTTEKLQPESDVLGELNELVESLPHIQWYDPTIYSDWRAEHVSRILELTALSQPMDSIPEPVDTTLPTYEGIDTAKAHDASLRLLSKIGDSKTNLIKNHLGRSKRADLGIEPEAVKMAWRSNLLGDYTVKALKEICKREDQYAPLQKTALVAKVKETLDEKYARDPHADDPLSPGNPEKKIRLEE